MSNATYLGPEAKPISLHFLQNHTLIAQMHKDVFFLQVFFSDDLRHLGFVCLVDTIMVPAEKNSLLCCQYACTLKKKKQ